MQQSPVTAEQVANYIINKCIGDKKPISNLQLQKILYLIQADYLKRHNKQPLFDERFHAWKYGPVIPQIYWGFSFYVGNPITDKQDNYDLSVLSDIDRKRIDSIVDYYRDMYPWKLVDFSHQHGGAWAKTYADGAGYDCEIDNNLIADDLTLSVV